MTTVYRFITLFLLACALQIFGCSKNPVDNGPTITVKIAPHVTSIGLGDTVRFAATVTGAADTSVTWKFRTAAPAQGTISGAGLYIAPDSISEDVIVVEVQATATADARSWDAATIAVLNRRDTPSVSTPVRPGVGSGYVFTSVKLDSAKQKIVSTERSYTDLVEKTGQNISGRDDVTIMLGDGSEIPIRYESNGDLSLLADGIWYLLPFGSGATVLLEKSDTTYADGTHRAKTTTASYAGEEVMTIGGVRLLTRKIVVNVTSSESSSSSYHSSATTTTFWFAPAIGWFTRIEEWDSYNNDGTRNAYGYSNVLTSYTLK
jgi:hypothetical protein